MKGGLTVVLDVGKTLTKLSLWDVSGNVLARETRQNVRIDAGAYAALDAAGIEDWAAGVLRDFAQRGAIEALVPVGHGAAFAVIADGRLACPPIDYEASVPPPVSLAYDSQRDPFSATGSPRLPGGLNLGVQIAWLETLHPWLPTSGARLLTWAQYWAWVFCGVVATEVTSLGCHSDLWRPMDGGPSDLALHRGWAQRLAPLRRAGEVLGTLRAEWAERTGLSSTVKVYCGLHDSNAALLAARGFDEVADQEATVLSTGTWFVAMRTPAPGAEIDIADLPETRDCLVNVDAFGRPVPSARFMGGREIEILSGAEGGRIDLKLDQPALLAAAAEVVSADARALPTFTPGVGPFPKSQGRWIDLPDEPVRRRAAVGLYAALVADASLGLIGAQRCILVEGRFAESSLFVRALAALRPGDAVYTSNARHDASYGALRLVSPQLRPPRRLQRVRPLDADLRGYAATWRGDAARLEAVT